MCLSLMTTNSSSSLLNPYTIWVLTPQLETDDPNLSYYYDFSQSIKEYTDVFKQLNAKWKWQPVTINNFKKVIEDIATSKNGTTPLVFNLCDGDEINGAPGISIIHELEKHGLAYTGSDVHFYELTTSKIPMKKAFDMAGVANAKWAIVTDNLEPLNKLMLEDGSPLIIKPAVSGGSMGVSVKNVVKTETELTNRLEEIHKGYRGWNLLADGLFAEQFITGPEYTTFITGSANDEAHCKVYEPVERVFHPSLPETEKFLSFDRLWEIYEEETPMPGNENFYNYQAVRGSLADELKELSLRAYKACGGKGYSRIDIRQEAASGKLLLLEVNAQCGLSEDEDYTSIGAILKASDISFSEIVLEIIKDALSRNLKQNLVSV